MRSRIRGLHIGMLGVTAAGVLVTSSGCGATAGSGPTGSPLPLASYTAAAQGPWAEDSPEGRAYHDELWNRYQDFVVECMHDAGFDYVAIAPPQSLGAAGSDSEIAPHSREYAQLYGYGIVTGPDGLINPLAPDDTAHDAKQAMSDAELEAYNTALWGPDSDWILADSEHEGEWNPQGCTARGQKEAFAEAISPPGGPFGELQAEIEALHGQEAEAPAVRQAEARWSDCMSDSGRPGYAKPDDVSDVIWSKLVAADDNGSEVTDAMLRELSALERELAPIDYACRETSGLDAAIQSARQEIEERFVAAHQAELEQWVAYEEAWRESQLPSE